MHRQTRNRGSAMAMTLLIIVSLTFAATTLLALSDSVSKRATLDSKVSKAAAVGEAGLAYVTEQWRKNSSYLDITSPAADGSATTNAQNSNIGVSRKASGGTFSIVYIRNVNLTPSTVGKVVRLKGTYDTFSVTWEALLGPNLLSPIQGVATTGNQTWSGTASFTGAGGTVFGNGNLTMTGTASITGEVQMAGSISKSSTATINGTSQSGVSTVAFPDQASVVASEQTAAKTASYSSITANITNVAAGTAIEVVNANAGSVGSGFSTSTNSSLSNIKNFAMKGGSAEINAGNYAFGRLWVDGGTLVIKAPANATSTLIIADLYLTNGAKLILDASAPNSGFKIMNATNNGFTGSVGTSGGQKWNGSSFTSGSPSIKFNGTTWNSSAPGSVKPARGNSYHDDWQIRDNSVFATVTNSPSAKGAEMFMPNSTDLCMNNGGMMVGGIQASDLATLKTGTAAQIDALQSNPTGFIAWSAGGGNPILAVNGGSSAGSPTYESKFKGMTYGGYQGFIGAKGDFYGAFVGQSLSTSGSFEYDANLGKLLVEPQPDSHHVIVKRRFQ